jgi:hypothetical protein
MKKALITIIPLFVAAIAVGVAFYFKMFNRISGETTNVIKEVPVISASSGKKPTSRLGSTNIKTNVLPTSTQKLEGDLPLPGAQNTTDLTSDSEVNGMINEINQTAGDTTSDINSLKTSADQL